MHVFLSVGEPHKKKKKKKKKTREENKEANLARGPRSRRTLYLSFLTRASLRKPRYVKRQVDGEQE